MKNKNKLKVGSNIRASGIGGFSFRGSTTKYFEEHIIKSIPFFKESHQLVSKISTFFISNKSIVYDLGCSTGMVSRAIVDLNFNKNFTIFGLDLSKDMINVAKKKLTKCIKIKLNILIAMY